MQYKIKSFFTYIVKYFFQGLIVIAPIGVTIWVIISLFKFVDNFLPNYFKTIAPNLLLVNNAGEIKLIPGLGFIISLILVVFIGWLSSLFFIERFMTIFDKLLEKTPGVKIIYSTVKDLLEAFTGDKKKFNKAVLVNIESNNIWRIGFITRNSNEHFNLPEFCTVYVPHSYAISGITYLVTKDRIKELPTNISATDAMKYIVSGGLTDVINENENT